MEYFSITSISLAAYLKTLGIEPVNIVHIAPGQIVLVYERNEKLAEGLKKYDNDEFIHNYKKYFNEYKKLARYGKAEE